MRKALACLTVLAFVFSALPTHLAVGAEPVALSGPTTRAETNPLAGDLLRTNEVAMPVGITLADPGGGGGDHCPLSGPFRIFIRGQCARLSEDIIVENGRSLFPMREMVERLFPNSVYQTSPHDPGFVLVDVIWRQEERTAVAATPSILLAFPENQNFMILNGKTVPLDVGAKILNGRTRVPLRYLAESLGFDVDFRARDNSIFINATRLSNILNHDIHMTCQLFGYPDGRWENGCPANEFYLGSKPFTTFGREFLLDQLMDGLTEDPARVYAINHTAIAIKDGLPLEGPDLLWREAFMQTGFDLITAWTVVGALSNATAPQVRNVVARALPETVEEMLAQGVRIGHRQWKFVARGNRLRLLAYQARKAGTTIRRRASGGYEIQEIGLHGVAFDGKGTVRNGVEVWLEAKSDGGWFLRGINEGWLNQPAYKTELLAEFERQMTAIQMENTRNLGIITRLEWHVETTEFSEFIRSALQESPLFNSEYFSLIWSP